LKNSLGSVFADVDAATEDFASGIENNEFYFGALAGMSDAAGDFTEHCFIEEIVFGAVEGHSSDAAVDAELHVFELFRIALLWLSDEFLGVDWFDHSCAPGFPLRR
jgi:hypothetical protein